jgi:plastocyanin
MRNTLAHTLFSSMFFASLVLAGCSSSSGETAPPADTGANEDTGISTGRPDAEDAADTSTGDTGAGDTGGGTMHTIHVGQTGFSFDPSTLTIAVGDTVVWEFDSPSHTVTSGSSCMPDNKFCSQGAGNCSSITMTGAQGTTFMQTFTTAGSYPYFCAIHCSVGMTGTITVQ